MIKDKALKLVNELIAENKALKTALAQPAQEPVAWMDRDGNFSDNNDHKCFPIPLYTITYPAPQQRPWVGLTEQERNDIEDYCEMIIGKLAFDAIEAKLKEKNHD